MRWLQQNREPLITPDYVLAETATLIRMAIDNIFVAKPGRRVLLVGFNGHNQAQMYSRQTRKFNCRISAVWVKLLCAYTAATPKPGELWEFWVAAKRVLDTSGRKVG